MDTLFVGQTHIHLKETDSTNNHALHLLSTSEIAEGTVVFTDKQTAGKGQRGNQWLMEPLKDMALSLILKPTFLRAEKQFLLNKAISLAVHDMIEQGLNGTKPDKIVKIKWPNDIMVNDKKIAGILIENLINGNTIKHSVVGIGINVNSSAKLASATSLKELSGREFLLEELMRNLCKSLERYYLLLRSDNMLLSEMYLKKMFRLNESSAYVIGDKKVNGKILGVDEYGKLIVEIINEKRFFDLKEISFII